MKYHDYSLNMSFLYIVCREESCRKSVTIYNDDFSNISDCCNQRKIADVGEA